MSYNATHLIRATVPKLLIAYLLFGVVGTSNAAATNDVAVTTTLHPSYAIELHQSRRDSADLASTSSASAHAGTSVVSTAPTFAPLVWERMAPDEPASPPVDTVLYVPYAKYFALSIASVVFMGLNTVLILGFCMVIIYRHRQRQKLRKARPTFKLAQIPLDVERDSAFRLKERSPSQLSAIHENIDLSSGRSSPLTPSNGSFKFPWPASARGQGELNEETSIHPITKSGHLPRKLSLGSINLKFDSLGGLGPKPKPSSGSLRGGGCMV